FELAAAQLLAIVRKVGRFQTRELNERPAYSLKDVADRYLRGRPAQRISAFGAAPAPDDIYPLQNLHNLKEELHRNALPLGDVLHSYGCFAIIVQRQFQYCRARIFISRGNLHNLIRRYPMWTQSVTPTGEAKHVRLPESETPNKKA